MGNDITNDIYKRFLILRNHLGLSQDAFGKPVEISQAYISDIEAGKKTPSDKLIRSICRHYGVPEEWLKHGKCGLQNSVNQPQESYDPHSGWKPAMSIEEMVGVPKGLGMAGAVDLLGRIYASKDETLIRCIFANLQQMCSVLDDREKHAAELSRLSNIEKRLGMIEHAGINPPSVAATIYAGPERRSGKERRISVNSEFPSDQERRSGKERRVA